MEEGRDRAASASASSEAPSPLSRFLWLVVHTIREKALFHLAPYCGGAGYVRASVSHRSWNETILLRGSNDFLLSTGESCINHKAITLRQHPWQPTPANR